MRQRVRKGRLAHWGRLRNKKAHAEGCTEAQEQEQEQALPEATFELLGSFSDVLMPLHDLPEVVELETRSENLVTIAPIAKQKNNMANG